MTSRIRAVHAAASPQNRRVVLLIIPLAVLRYFFSLRYETTRCDAMRRGVAWRLDAHRNRPCTESEAKTKRRSAKRWTNRIATSDRLALLLLFALPPCFLADTLCRSLSRPPRLSGSPSLLPLSFSLFRLSVSLLSLGASIRFSLAYISVSLRSCCKLDGLFVRRAAKRSVRPSTVPMHPE